MDVSILTKRSLVGAILLAMVAALLPLATRAPARAATGDPVLLNEVLASHSGTDDTEYFELFGTPGTNLAGLSVIVVESDSFAPGVIDRRFDFKAFHALGSNGFFLAGNCGGLPEEYGVTPDTSIFTNYFENSSLTVALVETASVGPEGSTITGAEVVLDSVALNDGDAGDTFFFGAPVIGPDGSFFPAGARRVADGVDTDSAADWVISDFFLGPDNTPTGGGLDGCAPLDLTIPEIQGDAQFSVFQGESVTTSGVVTAISTSGRDGFIQDVVGDGNPATSDGIFVDDFDDLVGVTVGDLITITGTVEEQQFGDALPLTRINNPTLDAIVSSGNALPEPVEIEDLPNESVADAIAFWEPLEGMRVALADKGDVVGPTNRFGEFVLLAKDDAKKGSGYFPQTKQILLRSLGPNDVDYNPERIMVDDLTMDAVQTRPGDKVEWLVGVVDYSFGNYKIQPTEIDVKTDDTLPEAPVSKRSGGDGDLVVTTFNVENLFDLVDNPDKDDIGTGGAETPEELETQLAKLALAIEVELELPDILVLQEVENTGIAQELGDRVNAATGTSYTAVSFETSDGRGIEVAFLYDADRVTLEDAFQLSGPDVEAAFGPSSPSPGREPLYGRFTVNGDDGGTVLHIVGNHFKSKGGDDPVFGLDSAAGLPFDRITEVQRKAQAQVVRDFVNGILDLDDEALVMVTGDLNDFQFGEPGEGPDDPLSILEGMAGEVPLTNLVFEEKDAERFSFVFDGNSQVLDHMLVSPELLDAVKAVDFLHFNASFEAALASDASTPIRATDHDPLEGRFEFDD